MRLIVPIIIIIGVVIFQSVFIVQEISQAIVLQFGDPKKIITKAGLNFKLPFIQNVVYLDKRILNLDSAPEEVIAADQKRLIVDAIARFKIVDPLKFYISVGNERVARSRLSTIINSRIRGVLGTQELATLLSTDRAKQMAIIQNDVNTEAKTLGIQIVVIGVFLFQSIVIVQEINQAIVLQFGDPKKIISKAGLNFKLPFIQNVVFLDKRILNLDNAPQEVIAADQKRLIVDAIARFKIVDPLKFYISVGNERVARSRLSTIINSRIRGVLGTQELATLLSTDRAKQMAINQNDVNTEAKTLGIQIVDVRIKRADLPPANSDAIYKRMQTEREREAKEFRAQGAEIAQKIRSTADKYVTVLLANPNKKSEIMKGEGDGQRNKIFANAFGQDPQFFAFYRAMQAYETALIGGETSLVLSPDSEFFKFFGKAMKPR